MKFFYDDFRNPHLDMLRAVSVVLVLFFHFGFEYFKGGFLGVDIFFVISGFLIIGTIVSQIEAGVFSLSDFWYRRIRRIVPAFLFILSVSMLISFFIHTPLQFKDFSQSLVASVSFLSNFLFFLESGYFDLNSVYKPLIHTWSLSVEEQFYLIFPVLLIIGSKIKSGLYSIAWVGLVCSLVGAFVVTPFNADAVFYFFFFRAWEFCIGGLAFMYMRSRSQPLGRSFYSSGLLSILAVVTFYPFIHVNSVLLQLIICLCVVFVVLSHPPKFYNLFIFKPVLLVGYASYSIYLVHQPLLSFYVYLYSSFPSFISGCILFVLSLLIGFSCWFFIERYFREIAGSKLVLSSSFGISFLLVCVGTYGHFSNGALNRENVSKEVINFENAAREVNPLRDSCHFTSGAKDFSHPISDCLVASPDYQSQIDVVFIGDSHLDSMSTSIRNQFSAAGVSHYLVSYGGCLPIPGFFAPLKPDLHCNEYVQSMLEYAQGVGAKAIVLVGRFPLYIEGTFFDNGLGGVESLVHDSYYVADPMLLEEYGLGELDRRSNMQNLISNVLQELSQSFELIVVEPVPEAGWNIPMLLSKQAMLEWGDEYSSLPLSLYSERTEGFRSIFHSSDSPVHSVAVSDIFCDPVVGSCDFSRDGYSLYTDDDHPSEFVSQKIAKKLLFAVKHVIN